MGFCVDRNFGQTFDYKDIEFYGELKFQLVGAVQLVLDIFRLQAHSSIRENLAVIER